MSGHEWRRIPPYGHPYEAYWECARCGGKRMHSCGEPPRPRDGAWDGTRQGLGCDEALASRVLDS